MLIYYHLNDHYPENIIPNTYETYERVKSILNRLNDDDNNTFVNMTVLKDLSEATKLYELLVDIDGLEYVNWLFHINETISTDVFRPKCSFKSPVPQDMKSRLSCYSFDSTTPVNGSTFKAAFMSAFCAYEAAKSIIKDQKVCYALSRPPGHHASREQLGGYCYFNNAFVAAKILYDKTKKKISILDVDYHHGNGTQELVYFDENYQYISIHEFDNEPWTGYTQENKGFRIYNLPIEKPITEDKYTEKLKLAILAIKDFNPGFLIVSFGADTYKGDPLISKGSGLSIEYYSLMGNIINQLNLKTLIVQEGGYNINALGSCVFNFLNSFK